MEGSNRLHSKGRIKKHKTGSLISSREKGIKEKPIEKRRERLKSALYLRLRKRKKTFIEKKIGICEFFSFRKCRIVPKKRDPLGLITYILLQNIKKVERGTLLIH